MDFGSFVLAAVMADLADEPSARPYADAVEFRLDLAEAPLEDLADYDGMLPVVATNRVRTEGGDAPDDSTRLDTLEAAIEHPAVEAVDVELAGVAAGVADPVISAARALEVAVIVSSHDFDRTPAPDEMAATLRRAAEAGDVGKLAVTATDPSDVLDLLSVTWSLTVDDVPVATMAMGDPGRHSRVVAPVYGSRIGYAPVDPAAATAPGQYDLETFRSLIDGLGPLR